MKKLLQDLSTGETVIIECPVPTISENSLLIATRKSLISAGTERMLVDFGKASYLEKARQQPEKVKMVLDKAKTDGLVTTYAAVKSKLSEPIQLGYSNVGTVEVVGAGVTGFGVGDRVVSSAPHADIVDVNRNLCARIPEGVSDNAAAFTVVGSIALQGIRLAKPTIGEAFAVIGAGLIGLLTVQILRANGCRVLAIDVDEGKLDIARGFGAETINLSSGSDIHNQVDIFSRSRGVDGVIVTASTKSNEPIKQAAQICRKRGRVVLVGVVGLDLDRADFYEKEITFQVSCSYGPGRYDHSYEVLGNDYPIGFVRWTEQRNFEAFLDLLNDGSVNVDPLISGEFEFDNAVSAYDKLTLESSALGLILSYSSDINSRLSVRINLEGTKPAVADLPTVGVLGAGNYASRVLIPAFSKAGANFETLVTANGLTAATVGKRFGFSTASGTPEDVFDNGAINTVVVATRHDTHAEYVLNGISAGKNVWVEKPICISKSELKEIEAAYLKQTDVQLMVGFNRRFAPHSRKIKELLGSVAAPKSVLITVNAGDIPSDHWTQDISIGGGRVIGECCHFIDLARYYVGVPIKSVQSSAMRVNGMEGTPPDSVTICLQFVDGSMGTIVYLANGPSSFPKERVEIFTEGKLLQLDNFRRLKGFGWREFKKMNLFSQDKGQAQCVAAFCDSLRGGEECIPAEEIFEVMRFTLDAANALSVNNESPEKSAH